MQPFEAKERRESCPYVPHASVAAQVDALLAEILRVIVSPKVKAATNKARANVIYVFPFIMLFDTPFGFVK
jgi:hypothetical protein